VMEGSNPEVGPRWRSPGRLRWTPKFRKAGQGGSCPHRIPAERRARRQKMSASRRKHEPAFKTKVALTLRGARRWRAGGPFSGFIPTRFTPGRRR
jgi:hypothetical protein